MKLTWKWDSDANISLDVAITSYRSLTLVCNSPKRLASVAFKSGIRIWNNPICVGKYVIYRHRSPKNHGTANSFRLPTRCAYVMHKTQKQGFWEGMHPQRTLDKKLLKVLFIWHIVLVAWFLLPESRVYFSAIARTAVSCICCARVWLLCIRRSTSAGGIDTYDIVASYVVSVQGMAHEHWFSVAKKTYI